MMSSPKKLIPAKTWTSAKRIFWTAVCAMPKDTTFATTPYRLEK